MTDFHHCTGQSGIFGFDPAQPGADQSRKEDVWRVCEDLRKENERLKEANSQLNQELNVMNDAYWCRHGEAGEATRQLAKERNTWRERWAEAQRQLGEVLRENTGIRIDRDGLQSQRNQLKRERDQAREVVQELYEYYQWKAGVFTRCDWLYRGN